MALKDTGEDGNDDVGALIYRESQLRKAEAAAAAATQRNKTSSDSTHHRSSTRKRSSITSRSKEPLSRPQRNGASKMRLDSSMKDGRPVEKVAKKRRKNECSANGCTNLSQIGGVCRRHGAKVKLCSSEGCTNKAHKGGVCVRHGAKVKRCRSEGCTNQAKIGGVCTRHGAKVKRCSSEGCASRSINGGVCVRHGAKVKLCSSEGCTNKSVKGGVCRRHGAKFNTQDQSTAFGSEFEHTTATQTLPNQRDSRAAARGQGGSIVPGEVTIPCQEFAEV
eukprot:scaffold10402_cov64-Skeletonema_dohrnii-CCMP3373.AAC.2